MFPVSRTNKGLRGIFKIVLPFGFDSLRNEIEDRTSKSDVAEHHYNSRMNWMTNYWLCVECGTNSVVLLIQNVSIVKTTPRWWILSADTRYLWHERWSLWTFFCFNFIVSVNLWLFLLTGFILKWFFKSFRIENYLLFIFRAIWRIDRSRFLLSFSRTFLLLAGSKSRRSFSAKPVNTIF